MGKARCGGGMRERGCGEKDKGRQGGGGIGKQSTLWHIDCHTHTQTDTHTHTHTHTHTAATIRGLFSHDTWKACGGVAATALYAAGVSKKGGRGREGGRREESEGERVRE